MLPNQIEVEKCKLSKARENRIGREGGASFLTPQGPQSFFFSFGKKQTNRNNKKKNSTDIMGQNLPQRSGVNLSPLTLQFDWRRASKSTDHFLTQKSTFGTLFMLHPTSSSIRTIFANANKTIKKQNIWDPDSSTNSPQKPHDIYVNYERRPH